MAVCFMTILKKKKKRFACEQPSIDETLDSFSHFYRAIATDRQEIIG